MNEAIQGVYLTHLKGKTAHEVWTTPKLETILAAVMTKIGQPLEKRGCLTCIYEGLTTLKEIVYKNMQSTAKYKLKNVTIGKLGFALDNDSLTDDHARRLLKRWPELIDKFDKFPKDWRVDCGLEEAPKIKMEKVEIPENTETEPEEFKTIPKVEKRKKKSD